jgi:hypothetical protein
MPPKLIITMPDISVSDGAKALAHIAEQYRAGHVSGYFTAEGQLVQWRVEHTGADELGAQS